MPQNAIIKADGTEDYTSDVAWEAAEQSSNYGSVTIARLDGNITRAARLTFSGTWTHGGRIEALSNDFDGDLNNNPPTITSTTGTNFIRNTSGKTLELSGVAMIHGGTVGALDCRSNSASKIITTNCFLNAGVSKSLFQLANSTTIDFNDSVGVNTGVQINGGSTGGGVTANNSSIFGDRNGDILNNGAANSTVIVNAQLGACFSGTTQSNNASTDATADTLDNIVVATEFVDSDPVGSGDYRIKAGSDLDTNGIGAFIQSAGGISITPDSVNTNYTSLNPSISLTGALSISESLVNVNYTSLDPSIVFTGVVSITEQVTNTNYTTLNPVISFAGILSISEQLKNINYTGLDPIIDLTGLVDIAESLVNSNYTSLAATITLTSGAVEVTESTVNTQYTPFNPSILLTPEPLGIVSTVCFNGVMIDLSFIGQSKELIYNGTTTTFEFSGYFNDLEFNGTIQTTCNTGSIKTNC